MWLDVLIIPLHGGIYQQAKTLLCIICHTGPPEITIISSSPTSGLAATDFSLELLITGTSPVTVQVFKDNVDVVDSGRVELSSMGTQHDLSIKDLRQADAGEYTILASNSIGKNSTTVTLNVEGKTYPE